MVTFSPPVLDIDLEKRVASFDTYPDLTPLLGGLATGLELLRQHKENCLAVLSVGPLNGFFPFVSKFCALSIFPEGPREYYIGGRFALIMKFANIDSLIVRGVASEPLTLSVEPSGRVEFSPDLQEEEFLKIGVAGRRSFITFGNDESLVDNYFIFDQAIGRKLYMGNLRRFLISASSSLKVGKPDEYKDIYSEILKKGSELEVSYSDRSSCGLCPAGCSFSKETEERLELVYSHCLVACGFASRIYENIPRIFSCLNSIGFPYKHEDLESLPEKIRYLRTHF